MALWIVVGYQVSKLGRSFLVLAITFLKQERQNRLEFENAVRGFGISTHSCPLIIDAPQPLHGHSFPAVAIIGRPVEPFISEGILFDDTLKLLNFSR